MYKLIKFAALVIFFFAFQNLDAQEGRNYKDRVFLKQGSVLVGSISNYVPGDSIVLTLNSGQQITIQDQQIKKVVMAHSKGGLQVVHSPMKVNRLYQETEFSFLANANGMGYSVSYGVLYQKDDRIAFGGGIGLDNYYAATAREIFPLYANARYNLSTINSAPFIGLKLGYGIAPKRPSENIMEANGGLMTNPYFGIRLGSQGLIINLFAGLKFQKVDYVIENNWDSIREDIFHRRLQIGISAMF